MVNCYGCRGMGTTLCGTCDGSGYTVRTSKDGTVSKISCSGPCGGSGKVTCPKCGGRRWIS
ncbi:hypothetical protein RirG_045450 [Rhizophagus irregularis DAOM 197198w]|uniref:CR-type domain-containing protein n=2 Tax=Rhizophagus irregularis TaxID=588596 RepID=A0A015JZT0_RHIIW|nr:hypothetical protein RirG_045450 [Rhizophagus irregularis DAOM 197198w]